MDTKVEKEVLICSLASGSIFRGDGLDPDKAGVIIQKDENISAFGKTSGNRYEVGVE